MDESGRAPLPGQLQLTGFAPEIPATKSRWLKRAWNEGQAAALAGKSLVDEPDPPRRGYGESIAARRAHAAYCRAYGKWWRDGFQSVTLFPISGGRGQDDSD